MDRDDVDRVRRFLDADDDEKQEIAEELMEEFGDGDVGMSPLSSLDVGEEPEEVDDEEYINEIVPEIEEATGLEHPDDPVVIEYENGGQMLHDAMEGAVDQQQAMEQMQEGLEELQQDVSGMGTMDTVKRVGYVAKRLGQNALRNTKGLEYMAERVAGITEASIVGGDAPTVAVDDDVSQIAIAKENIQRRAEENDIDPDLLERYVKTHEGIHKTDFYNYPNLNERREELTDEMQGALFASQEDWEDVKDGMQAFMAVVEGHAEYVTNEIYEGEDLEFDRSYDLMDRVKLKALGLEEKMAQYSEGAEFIEHLYDEGGADLANQALEHPPESMDEIYDPEQWMDRVDPDY